MYDEPAYDAEDLVREVQELLGKPEPGVNGRVGFIHDPERFYLSEINGKPVDTVAVTDVL